MNKNIPFLIIFSVTLLFSGFFVSDALAEQYPGLVVVVNSDPYYWSEKGFGWDALEQYKAPNIYQTDPSQSKDEALKEFTNNAEPTIISPATEDDRVVSMVVTISGPDIVGKKSFYTFSSLDQPNTGTQFSLESLASKDKEFFYEFVSRFINPGDRPDPFDVQIDLVTGDGTILNSWEYFGCKITSFDTYRMENVLILSFLDKFSWEIRDHTEFDCDSKWLVSDSSSMKNPYTSNNLGGPDVLSTEKLGLIPSDDDRLMAYSVSIVGAEVPEKVVLQEFPLFGIIGSPISDPTKYAGSYTIDPKFYLEGLVSKNKKPFYEYISRYFDSGKTPEPFDVVVDNITGDGTTLIQLQYVDCQPTKFYTYGNDNLLTNKMHPGKDTEIRDHIEFDCDGFRLVAGNDNIINPYNNIQKQLAPLQIVNATGNVVNATSNTLPLNSDRVMDYVVHFEDGDFENDPLILPTFSQLTMTGITSFDLSSLPGLEKARFYNLLIGPSINPGKTPEPFDVVVDLVAGDSDIIIKYNYEDCTVTDYQQFLMNSLVTYKFTHEFEPEIRDTTSFSCSGFNMASDFEPSSSPFSNILNPSIALQNTVDLLALTNSTVGLENTVQGQIIPNNMTSVDSFIVHFSGRELPEVKTMYTIGSFSPLTPTISNDEYLQSTPPKFELQSLPSKDKELLYKLASEKPNPGKDPEPLNITIDSVTGDGTILFSWLYFDCNIDDYRVVDDDFLLFMKYTGKSAPEITDITDFECEGFHLDTKDGDSYSPYTDSHIQTETTQLLSVVPDDDERIISLVVSISNGEFAEKHSFFTSTKYAKHDGPSFTFYTLVNHDFDLWHTLVADRYYNPGKTPERFDATIDFVTGDGTTLQSWQYHKCEMDGLMFFTSDNWAFIRQSGELVPEIRGKYTMDCAGYYGEVDDIEIEHTIPEKSVISSVQSQDTDYIPPLKQIANGISPNDVTCRDEMTLVFNTDNDPRCVTHTNVEKLVELGWTTSPSILSEKTPKPQTNIFTFSEETLEPEINPSGRLIPSNQSRVHSFNVNFIGQEIPEGIDFGTFSSFVPLTTSSVNPYSSNQMQQLASSDFGDVVFKPEMKPEFALKYLPTKDKKPFYDIMSRYFNPGKTPELFDVTIEFVTVYNSTVSTWMYSDCKAESHHTSLDDSLLNIKFHGSWTKEFRDKTTFSCNGFGILSG